MKIRSLLVVMPLFVLAPAISMANWESGKTRGSQIEPKDFQYLTDPTAEDVEKEMGYGAVRRGWGNGRSNEMELNPNAFESRIGVRGRQDMIANREPVHVDEDSKTLLSYKRISAALAKNELSVSMAKNVLEYFIGRQDHTLLHKHFPKLKQQLTEYIKANPQTLGVMPDIDVELKKAVIKMMAEVPAPQSVNELEQAMESYLLQNAGTKSLLGQVVSAQYGITNDKRDLHERAALAGVYRVITIPLLIAAMRAIDYQDFSQYAEYAFRYSHSREQLDGLKKRIKSMPDLFKLLITEPLQIAAAVNVNHMQSLTFQMATRASYTDMLEFQAQNKKTATLVSDLLDIREVGFKPRSEWDLVKVFNGSDETVDFSKSGAIRSPNTQQDEISTFRRMTSNFEGRQALRSCRTLLLN